MCSTMGGGRFVPSHHHQRATKGYGFPFSDSVLICPTCEGKENFSLHSAAGHCMQIYPTMSWVRPCAVHSSPSIGPSCGPSAPSGITGVDSRHGQQMLKGDLLRLPCSLVGMVVPAVGREQLLSAAWVLTLFPALILSDINIFCFLSFMRRLKKPNGAWTDTVLQA